MRYLFLFLIIITCFSCSKEDECKSYSSTTPIAPCLNGFLFDSGSYWVYQDTATLQLDSIYVVNWSHEWKSGTSGTFSSCPSSSNVEIININYFSTRWNAYSESLYSEYINIFPLANYDSRLYDCKETVFLDSLVVLNYTFYNVEKISRLDSSNTLYYKDGVGVIRRVEYNPHIDTATYDLINYQVSLFQLP